MPLAKALRSFKGRYGHIRAGTTFNCAPGYYAALEKKGWVQLAKVEEPGPSDNRAIPGAPNKSGELEPGGEKDPGKAPAAPGGDTSQNPGGTEPDASNTADPPASGRTLTSRSLRRGRASQRATSNLSVSGGRKPDPQNLDE